MVTGQCVGCLLVTRKLVGGVWHHQLHSASGGSHLTVWQCCGPVQFGETALHLAAKSASACVVRVLLDQGASTEARATVRNGNQGGW